MAVNQYASGTFTASEIDGADEELTTISDAGVYVVILQFNGVGGDTWGLAVEFSDDGAVLFDEQTLSSYDASNVSGQSRVYGPFVVATGQVLKILAAQLTDASPAPVIWVVNQVG